MAGNNEYEYKHERRGKRDVGERQRQRARARGDRVLRRGACGLRMDVALRHDCRETQVRDRCQAPARGQPQALRGPDSRGPGTGFRGRCGMTPAQVPV